MDERDLSILSTIEIDRASVWISMFSNLSCRNVDLQMLNLLTAAVSTVRMDTVGFLGKPVIQSIFQTLKDLLANVYVLKQEF